jgi:hypothetical protein
MKNYVYVYLDKSIVIDVMYNDIYFHHMPIYVGKGIGKRMYVHLNCRKRIKSYFYKKLNKMINENNNPLIYKIMEFDNELDAFDFEIKLIKSIGKKINGGLLYNISDGGDGVSGYNFTDEVKNKMREYALENKSHLHFPNNSGELHPMFGRKHKKESIDKMKESHTGVKQSVETIEKRMLNIRGYPMSEKGRINVANAMFFRRGISLSEDHRNKISISKIGKDTWNKGNIKDIILQIDSNNVVIKEWNNLTELSNNGYDKSNVINVCQGKRKTHHGYSWVYKSNYIEIN